MRRNVDEVIASQNAMLRRSGKADDQVESARLAEIYRRQLLEVGDWLAAQPNFSVLVVDYPDVLGDPERVMQELDRFLDGRLDREAMRRVPDQSLYRQRKAQDAAVETGTS